MPAATAAGQATSQASTIRPVGVVTELKPGQMTLHTDSGPDLTVFLPDGTTVLSVPPGAKDLKSATPLKVEDISPGDRVLVRGTVSDDQKSATARSVIVMSRASLAAAHHEESQEWQKRGIGGVVKSVDSAAKQITIAVPNNPPTPGNPTHPVVISLAANAVLLRYAPDSVKFSDAKPGPIQDIKAGDQLRALGTKSEDGASFTADKLVSGTFRNIGATVISVDAEQRTMTVKDLANGKPLLVKINAESKLHTLPPFLAMMIARFNSGGAPGGPGGPPAGQAGGPGAAGAQAAERSGGNQPAQPQPAGGYRGPSGGGGAQGGQGWQGRQGGQGGWQGRQGGFPGGPGGTGGGPPRDFNQMLERTPQMALADLKAGQALIIVSTEGAKPAEVTAIAVLAGVEPILEARPKGSNEVFLGPWNMSAGGGGGGDEGP
ncbi:MAG: hypothetical protein ACM3NO_04685 [Deltaproteobacteria bacterium]